MNSFNGKLFLILVVAFIAATVIGTLSHEFGHFVVAKNLGYNATINYNSTSFSPANSNERITGKNYFYTSLGGPIQTMLTGTIGFLLLYIFRNRYFFSQELHWKEWTIIFIALFWLRQTANLFTWVSGYILTGKYSAHGDELVIAKYLKLPGWSMITVTGIIGLLVLIIVVFKFVPIKQRLTFLAAGLTGGIAGYILWLEIFGQYIFP